MALFDMRGHSHEYPLTYVVGREKIKEYAAAVKNFDPAFHDVEAAKELGYDDLPAPLTFVAIIALLVQKDFFRTHEIGMETAQIVQVDQQFLYHSPIKVGDELKAVFHVESVTERFGAVVVMTRNVLTNQQGETVLEAYTTLMGQEGDETAKVKFDAATGTVVRAD